MSKDRIFPTGSRRDNADGKPPLSKLPWTALSEVALVHQWGDDHYGMGNWRKGQFMSDFIDSGMRHAEKANKGEDRDPKSGQLHLAQAAWNILIALHQQVHADHYAELDNRMDDFGNWVNEVFAQTDAAKLLAAGDSLRQHDGNGEADPVNVKVPQNGGSVEAMDMAPAEVPEGHPRGQLVTDEMLREGH